MLNIFKRSKNKPTEQENDSKPSLLGRLKQSLTRTRENLGEGVARIIKGKKTIDDDLFTALETQLLSADIGAATVQRILDDLTEQVERKHLQDPASLLDALKQGLMHLLTPCEQAFHMAETTKPYVILLLGVNGSGKTTTIGKLAKRLQNENKSVMLAAGDTFRAAAIEQLQVWGERNDIPVVAQHTGADSASVIFDAVQSAQSRGIDVVIADTAGRLHTQSHLMEELKKVVRVMKKLDGTAPHEVMLVLDAGIGQNALQQAKEFHSAVGLTGITLTKLDGTAKGGIIFAIANQLQLPIRFIGIGEGIDDLRSFSAKEFVEALFE